MSVKAQNTTVKDALVSLLRGASRHNRNDMVAPVAILWTDENSVWASVIAALRTSLAMKLSILYFADAREALLKAQIS